ncbi:16346_t:CDS:2 [Funneliformis caledonium]|uniref:16346_t:CDS:1 n=1 Tax=Funneliformis caledonium TaxID=1117310 RepID=A0A9N9DY04_9GLOM|nr:16346_t:CDS:2 [Funneliformis caledonium]
MSTTTLHHVHFEESSFKPQHQANAAPLALSSFAMTSFVYSIYLTGAGGITNSNVGLGLALFYGGAIQLLAGLFELKRGDVFHATVFSSYGGYWICFGFVHFDATGIIASYKDDPEMLKNALGIFLIGWTIFTVLMLICVLKSNLVLIAIFFLMVFINVFLTIATFTGNRFCEVVGGILGVIVAFLAWYLSIALILTKENSYFTLNIWPRVHPITSSEKV